MTTTDARLPADKLTPGVSAGGPLDSAIGAFAAAVVCARSVDPIITELVRLRCAQTHDCRLCGSLRNQEALEDGFDESMQRKIASYETSDFKPEIIAARRLCDAMILSPSFADEALKVELEKYFTPTQTAEICLDVVKWSQQKALVALRSEAPPWDTTNILTFDEQGNPGFGGEAYV